MGISKELILFDSKLVGVWNVVFAHAYNTNLINSTVFPGNSELPFI
jgi:hypothetical protein